LRFNWKFNKATTVKSAKSAMKIVVISAYSIATIFNFVQKINRKDLGNREQGTGNTSTSSVHRREQGTGKIKEKW
jgi:uncharacterized membrane protein